MLIKRILNGRNNLAVLQRVATSIQAFYLIANETFDYTVIICLYKIGVVPAMTTQHDVELKA